MGQAKVAISIDDKLLVRLDALVSEKIFSNRSRAIQQAVEEKLAKLDKSRLARECANLDVNTEIELAEEGMADEVKQWPIY